MAGIVYLVGAGPGDPGLITRRGLECIEAAEVLVYDRLVSPRLARQAPAAAERIYVGKGPGHAEMTQEEINALLVSRGGEGKVVTRLKGGDPFVFGRGGEEALALWEAGIPFQIVPGVTSAIAVPAYAGIPVTHRSVAAGFTVLTGHREPGAGPHPNPLPIVGEGISEPSPSPRGRGKEEGTLVVLMGTERIGAIARSLIEAGRSTETPVALVRWGTTTRQETVVGTLGDIEEKAKAVGMAPPAVAIIGEVVRLRDRLSWFEGRPLHGQRVLVTRAREQASDLAARLETLGAEVIELPTIRSAPPTHPERLEGALDRLGEYAWVVFTSAQGVEHLWERLLARGWDARGFARAHLAAVGPGTTAALEARGLRPDYVPDQFTTAALAEGLVHRLAPGDRVLLARAENAPPELGHLLGRAGVLVEEAPPYRTVPDEAAEEAGRERLLAGEVEIITFTSSSTVRNLLSALDGRSDSLRRPLIACIGPVTAQTAREAGLRVDVVASPHTVEGLVEAIVGRVKGEGWRVEGGGDGENGRC